MIELLTSMWGFLAGAGVIGLLIGWGVRGVFIAPAKTVNVTSQPVVAASLSAEQQKLVDEADNTKFALTNAQGQIVELQEVVSKLRPQLAAAEAQIASLETAAAEPAETHVPDDASEADAWMMRYYKARIHVLEDQMANAESVSASEPEAPEGVEAAPLAVADLPSEDQRAAEVWQKRYLESRVRFLEARLAEAVLMLDPEPDAPSDVDVNELKAEVFSLTDKLRAAESVAAKAGSLEQEVSRLSSELQTVKTAPQPEAVQTEEPTQPDRDASTAAKLTWQNRYLKARLNHLENASARPLSLVSESQNELKEELNTLRSEVKTLRSELTKAGEGSGDAEQELAKLRWRNRYLEGRLKYLEAATLDAASDADDSIVVADEGPAIETPDTPSEDEPDNVVAFARVSEASDVEEVRPPSLDAPEGLPDDLKQIGGIGPKIEGLLNHLGIFHYRQIASWQPGEEAWIDSYLRFQGRVIREKWVDQAAQLSQSAASE